jgi:hypothetical protein
LQQYDYKVVTAAWSNKTVAANGIAPDTLTIAPSGGDAITVDHEAAVDISQAKSIEMEIDTVPVSHVATSVDVHVYTGLQHAVLPTTPKVSQAAVGVQVVIPVAVTVGGQWLWVRMDHNDNGKRADVTVRLLIRE